MKKIITLLTLILGMTVSGWAVPNQITYQGTLKEKGVPANGTKNMKFEILNGNQSIWTYQKAVAVTNGLFSVLLNPTGVDWEHITPSLQITIENQLLTPPEPITANAYSMVASAVIDKAISPSKVADGYGLVPAGAILMFATACPSGWTRFTALDNRFPMGNDVYGNTGGSLTHSHTIPVDGNHTHSTANALLTSGGIGSGPTCFATAACPGWDPSYPGQTTSSSGSHDHGGATATTNTLPPFLSLIYCQKL